MPGFFVKTFRTATMLVASPALENAGRLMNAKNTSKIKETK